MGPCLLPGAQVTTPLARVTLMLDVDTCTTAPAFFSLLALLLRRGGAKVLLVAGHDLADAQLLQLGISFTDFKALPRDDYHEGKRRLALAELQARRSVLWVDTDFDGWQGGDVDNLEGLAIINWGAVSRQGVKPLHVGEG